MAQFEVAGKLKYLHQQHHRNWVAWVSVSNDQLRDNV